MSRAAVWTPRHTHQLYEAQGKTPKLNLRTSRSLSPKKSSRSPSPSSRVAPTLT